MNTQDYKEFLHSILKAAEALNASVERAKEELQRLEKAHNKSLSEDTRLKILSALGFKWVDETDSWFSGELGITLFSEEVKDLPKNREELFNSIAKYSIYGRSYAQNRFNKLFDKYEESKKDNKA